jgi:hypothetical protein
VTLVSDDAAVAERLREQGYHPVAFSSNYPASIPVEAVLWEVPEPVAAKVAQFTAPSAQAPGARLLVMPLAARGLMADAATETDFFRRVLGVDVPRWPVSGSRPANVRVQAWAIRAPDGTVVELVETAAQ